MSQSKEKLYHLIKEACILDIDNQYLKAITTHSLSQQIILDRTTISKYLTQLVTEKKIIKIRGKPVRYFPNIVDNKICVFEDEGKFWKNIANINGSLSSITIDTRKRNASSDAFSEFIGSTGTLSYQVNQGKAAILYPPNGIHTLLTGPTGVGKTKFAKLMYNYAIDLGRLTQKSPFVYYNCADYAGNVQLLMSLLFGHTKGAFTGANTKKKGLVDAADGGILFLDEIHRLPSEGQEMLFSILDNGTFRRLGESNGSLNRVTLLLIGATTENIENSILKTFKRRIPNIISIPGLEERSINERLQLIDLFFRSESQKIQNKIIVEKEVLKLLTIYDCSGNVGQLKNDIQMMCAHSFAQAIIHDEDQIKISIKELDKSFNKKYTSLNNCNNKKNIMDCFSKIFADFVYEKGNRMDANSSSIRNRENKQFYREQNFYHGLLNKYTKLFEKQKNIKMINQLIQNELEKFFNIEIFTSKDDSRQLEKIVSENVLVAVKKIFKRLKTMGNFKFDNQVMYSLCLHVETLLLKMKNGSINNKKTINNYRDTYGFFSVIEQTLMEEIKISFNEKEIAIMSTFLEAIYETKKDDSIGIIIIMHGENTATSMAKVVNELLDTNHAKSIDMKLSDSVYDTLDKACEMALAEDKGKGVLLLVDMGSLNQFSVLIEQKTGVKMKVISMASTATILEATRKSMIPNMDINKLIDEVFQTSNLIGNNNTKENFYNHNDSSYSIREDERLNELIKNNLIFLNGDKSIDILSRVLSNICNAMSINMSDEIYIKFQFHCQSMLERIIRKEFLKYRNYSNIINKNIKLYELIKQQFSIIENTYAIIIPDSEIAYIVEIINSLN
ncbi:sigma-54-dependent transcriptional regulator [Clostridium sp. Marseille-Q2269]|uniref:sigma 54-interacting transcriptional regulator n=1 Tax=Clostridium sp. Marseille-Q2269 TaxID=2942205 RepID=UPI002073A573|nr:sigma-54-dependent transcriptional regulator [Clostridium sp. Marseille-Q2269]